MRIELGSLYTRYVRDPSGPAKEELGEALLTVVKKMVRAERARWKGAEYECLEDVIGNILAAAWGSLSNFNPVISSLDTYVYSIVRSKVADAFREMSKRAVERRYVEEVSRSKTPHPDSALLVKELLRQLTPDEAAIAHMIMDGLTSDEVGEAMKITPATARKRWERIRCKLRNFMSQNSLPDE